MSSDVEDDVDAPFELVSETEVTLHDRLARMYEEYLYIPTTVRQSWTMIFVGT